MAYASNHGVRIHYEVEGNGPPLVLQHPLNGSLRIWHDLGWVEGLKNDYRLILVDARGHGSSDKPHDAEAYTSKARAGDIVAVLDELTLSKAHFFGYSMGGVDRICPRKACSRALPLVDYRRDAPLQTRR